jgi:hypothetical protein
VEISESFEEGGILDGGIRESIDEQVREKCGEGGYTSLYSRRLLSSYSPP